MTAPPDVTEVHAALAGVRDPELDEAITDLGFVESIDVDDGGEVRVRLRLPTYFCAPNFAWLMTADTRDAVETLPGVVRAHVQLTDHMTADAINAGVGKGQDFEQAFPGLADGDIDELRRAFRRKAFAARQARLCRRLLEEGSITVEGLAALRVGDLPPGRDTDTYLDRRAELGIDTRPSAPLFVRPDGRAIPQGEAAWALRRGRLTGVSIEGNAGFCRGLLATRYGTAVGRQEADSGPTPASEERNR